MGPRSSRDPQGDNIETIEISFNLEITEELRKLVLEAIAKALSWKPKWKSNFGIATLLICSKPQKYKKKTSEILV